MLAGLSARLPQFNLAPKYHRLAGPGESTQPACRPAQLRAGLEFQGEGGESASRRARGRLPDAAAGTAAGGPGRARDSGPKARNPRPDLGPITIFAAVARRLL